MLDVISFIGWLALVAFLVCLFPGVLAVFMTAVVFVVSVPLWISKKVASLCKIAIEKLKNTIAK